MPLPVYLTVEGSFASAHFLPDYDGKCKNMHGHLWKIEVTFGPFENRALTGIACDFHTLKHMVGIPCEILDHHLLNDFVERPTAENLVGWFKDILTENNPAYAPYLEKIKLWESPTSSCTWDRGRG